jgi:hypothetical protein
MQVVRTRKSLFESHSFGQDLLIFIIRSGQYACDLIPEKPYLCDGETVTRGRVGDCFSLLSFIISPRM